VGLLDRALSMLSGDGGDSSGPRCPRCRGPLRLEDPSDGMYVCDACTGAVYFDEGDGKIIDAMTHRSRVYERRKAAGAFDGPVIYRVTWMLTDGSRERRTQDFTNIDHGYDFYNDRQKDPYCADVTWNHIRG
jgi:hypothetical protein